MVIYRKLSIKQDTSEIFETAYHIFLEENSTKLKGLFITQDYFIKYLLKHFISIKRGNVIEK